MKLFKIFNTLPFKKSKLPSKEFLYKTFYHRKKYPYSGLSKKYSNDNDKALKDLELEFLENLIDNYPSGNLHEVKTTKDFTLDCLIPEKLYKIRCTIGGNFGDVGLVYVEKTGFTVFYSNTYLFERGTHYPEDIKFDRTEIKKEILSLFSTKL